MQKPIRAICCILIFLFLAANGAPGASLAFAADKAPQTIRIGYFKGDPRFQDGFSDGERKTGYAYEYYQAIASLTGWSYEYVYGSREEVMDRLIAGEVDVVAGVYQTDKRTEQVSFSRYAMGLDGEPRYFAVNIRRGDLLEALNQAQEQLFDSRPDFTASLLKKYYDASSHQQILTGQELEWLAAKGSLRFGYVQSNLPVSGQEEDGSPAGVARTLVEQISSYLKVPLTPVCYANVEQMEEGLRSGEIDAAFPMYSDLWLLETMGFLQSDILVDDRAMIVYNGSYRSGLTDQVALSRNGLGQHYYVQSRYPDAEIVLFDTKTDALDALKRGQVNSYIGCSSVIQRLIMERADYQQFSIAYLEGSEEFSIAVRQRDSLLLQILNKAVRQMDASLVTDALIQYSNVSASYSLKDFLRYYSVVVIAVLGAFFAILAWMFFIYRRRTNQFNAEQARTRAALEVALEAANAASRAKTSFLSSMSHDIRTPMNGIIGMTAIAATHIDDRDRVRDCLAKITSSSKHLLALINEILDMSKIESGEISLNDEIVDLTALMDDLITLNKPQADLRRHQLEVRIVNVSHEKVTGDGTRLQQVFTNLVSNAIKYTPNGGLIEISLTEGPSSSASHGSFEFVVKDNGIGMSESYLPHIFEAFTRSDDTSKNQIQGTGLGMAIVHNIVEIMGGTITVESALDQGSTFTVTLPLKLRDAEDVDLARYADLDVLVVDDDQASCDCACLFLSEIGMDSEWVLSGQEAVERVEKRHRERRDYFAVLVDWKMPGMDGVETARQIRSRVGADVPIIVISSYDWSDIEAEAMKAGVNGFIGKPLFKSRLVQLFYRLTGTEDDKNCVEIKELAEITDFSGKRALLAEDNDLNAEIAVEILGMTGLYVEWAHDGQEALDMLERSEPGYYDCILMDIQMPVLDGISATKKIRGLSHADARAIPIFAMTANAFQEDVRAALDAGMNEHIAKPLDFDVLLQMLRKYL